MGKVLVTLAVWLIPLVALAGEERPRPELPEQRGQDAEQRIREVLAARRVTFDFVETPLADVVNFLAALVDANMVVLPGVNKQAAVTLRVNEMPLGQALQWIARLVGARVDVREGAVVIEPGRDERREPPPGPRRPFGRATLSLGPGLTIEMELGEDDLRPEARQLLLFLLHRQIMGEAQKHDPKAIQEFMEGMAKQRQMEAEMRRGHETLRQAMMDADARLREAEARIRAAEEARRRAEEEARRARERRERPEGGERKGEF